MPLSPATGSTRPSEGVVARWFSASGAVLKSMDSWWAWVMLNDGVPYFQSGVVCMCLGVERGDFSWFPHSWSWLHEASVIPKVPDYQFDGQLRRSGTLTVVYLGELETRLRVNDDVPDPLPEGIGPYDLAMALAPCLESSWVICSFDHDGQLDHLGDRPSAALNLEPGTDSWVPDGWRFGSNHIHDAITGLDGVTRLVDGELVAHRLGTLAMFRVYAPNRTQPWSRLMPWQDL